MTRARFVVRGVVQGVNFRAVTLREAATRGLTGRVWNRDDGAVELIAEGDADALAALERWLGHGPRMAEVERVERTDLGGATRYRDFQITYVAPE
jgi:acylphosphatase